MPPTVMDAAIPAPLLGLLAVGCLSDHNALAAHHDPPEAGAAGRAAAPKMLDASAIDASARDVDASKVDGDSAGTASEPQMPWSLTLVHGIVDETQEVQFCLSRTSDAGEVSLGSPFPKPALRYSGSTVVETIDHRDAGAIGLRVHVLAGNLSLVDGLGCEAALAQARDLAAQYAASRDAAIPGDAGSDGGDAAHRAAFDSGDAAFSAPPPLRTAPVALLPAGTFAEPQSYLLVVAGCLRGADAQPVGQEACGESWSGRRTSLTPVLVRPAKSLEPGEVGLQFVNGSRAFASATLGAIPADSGSATTLSVASNVQFGEIAPKKPVASRSERELSTGSKSAGLEIRVPGDASFVFQQDWRDTVRRAGLDSLKNGRAYTVVLLGPGPETQGPWNGRALTVVDNTPLSP